jgi:inosine/xanthosine triphosphatase
MFSGAELNFVSVESEVSDQPKTFEESVRGAQNRARNAFSAESECDYSIGIESGLFEIPLSDGILGDLCVCVVFNGKDFTYGFSCGMELPKKISDLMMNDGLDMNQASNEAGLTKNPNLGEAEGLIGVLTKGRISRKRYTKQAVMTALIKLENGDIYNLSY